MQFAQEHPWVGLAIRGRNPICGLPSGARLSRNGPIKIAFCIAAGAVLQSLIAVAPWLAIAGTERLAVDLRFWIILVSLNLLFAADLRAMRRAERPLGPFCEIDRRLHRLSLASCVALLLIFWAAELEAGLTSPSLGPLTLGAVTALCGVILRSCAISQLGRQFISEAARPGDGALVQTGVYAWVRHPSETGLLLIAGGAAILMESSAAAILIVVLLLPLMIARLRLEDQSLRDAFGAQFDRYRARVRALAPFVY